MKFLFIVVLFFSLSSIFAQTNRFTVSGLISDNQGGEILIGANVYLLKDTSNPGDIKYYSSTNKFGFYSITNVPEGKWFLIASMLGYQKHISEIGVAKEGGALRLDIELVKSPVLLNEVVVSDSKDDFPGTAGTIVLDPGILKQLPSTGGETDIFRALQLLPGVASANELSTGLYVRGGSADHTLTLIDGVPVYNPSHLGGFSSAFNPDAIQGISLIKGAFPAEFGGRLSSVLDITMKEGTKEKFKGTINISNISSRMSVEGPVNENSSYILSARIMYLDKMLQLFPQADKFPLYSFYDANGKVNITLNDKDKIFLSGFFSSDKLTEPPYSKDVGFDISWNNATLNLTWTRINNPTLFTNTSILLTNYGFQTSFRDKQPVKKPVDFFSSSSITDLKFKTEFQLTIDNIHFIRGGAEVTYHSVGLLVSDFYTPELTFRNELSQNYNALDGAFFVQDEWKINRNFNANAGVRVSYFKEAEFLAAEPRLSLSYFPVERLTIKSSFAIAYQPMHKFSRYDIQLPSDIWYPSSIKISPAKAIQGSFGFEAVTMERDYLFSIEGYYKKMENLFDYIERPDFAYDAEFESQLTRGWGESYGLEIFFNKKAGKITGWIGYTLAFTKRYFEEINKGNPFFPRYDRRHDFSAVISWNISENLAFGATWTYSTGQTYSIPVMQFGFQSLENPNINDSKVYYEFSERDAYRLPDFHKLDLSLTYKTTIFNSAGEISFNVYNAYNRNNIFSKYVGYIADSEGNKKPVLKQFVLFPFVPSLGVKIDL
ncbi:MAG: TonB-dependent receptor [Ignavibacteriaceae bacterium]|nr:TonB-dependent receptor [Ignavibacteriaceae bacterium]